MRTSHPGRILSSQGLSIAALFLLMQTPLLADQNVFCGGDFEEVRAGQVVVADQPPTDGIGVAMHACGRVPAPPADVWLVLRNCDNFDDFMPSVTESHLEKRVEGIAICDTTIDLPFPLGDMRSVTRAVERELDGGGFERRWTLLRGSYARNNGAWIVRPWPDDSEETLLQYEIDIDPDTVIPDFLLRRVQSSTAPEVFEAIRERVEVCSNGAAPDSCR